MKTKLTITQLGMTLLLTLGLLGLYPAPPPAVAATRPLTAQAAPPDGLMEAFYAAAAHDAPTASLDGSSLAYREQKVLASGSAGDRFGVSVAVSGDTALVGAYLDDVGPNPDQGSVYVFRRWNSVWVLEQRLTAVDGAQDDLFGVAVALDGDTALVGANLDDVSSNEDQGSVYVFARTGTTWTQQAKLTALDGAVGDNFGFSVALDGDTALVGAWYDDVSGSTDQGSAYVFVRSGSTWTQQANFTGSTGSENDCFGFSVALDGDTAVVGAPFDTVDGNGSQGSAYVFTRSGLSWSEEAQLFSWDGLSGDRFGFSVAVEGNTILVGALDADGIYTGQGAAYLFIHNGSWEGIEKLMASDGEQGDDFGIFVALDGGTAIIGADGKDIGGEVGQGAAYIFTQDMDDELTWTQQRQITAPDGAAGDRFGQAVALSGNTVLIGAWKDDVGANAIQGSAYVFTGSGADWEFQAQLTGSEGEEANWWHVRSRFGEYRRDCVVVEQCKCDRYQRGRGICLCQQRRLLGAAAKTHAVCPTGGGKFRDVCCHCG